MANIDRRDANLKKLQEANQIQDKTKEAIWRIQKQAAEAEELGAQTLDELRRQGQQMVVGLPRPDQHEQKLTLNFFYTYV
jgi:hypothetical protein